MKFYFSNGDINESVCIYIYKGIDEFSKIKRYRDGGERVAGRKIYGGKERRECEKNLIFRKSIRLSVELRRANEVVCIFHRARIDFLSSPFSLPLNTPDI